MSTISTRWQRWIWLLAICGVGSLAGGLSGQSGSENLWATSTYVLDLSKSENGGIAGGTFWNLAFVLNLSQSTSEMAVRYGDQRLPRLVATFDYADCTKGQEGLLEEPLRKLARGDFAWVDSIEVEMLPLQQEYVRWSGGVCYGYRDLDGQWRWELTTTLLAYDAATDRVRARISVQKGPLDALKLVFDYTVPRQSVSRVTFTARPMVATPSEEQ